MASRSRVALDPRNVVRGRRVLTATGRVLTLSATADLTDPGPGLACQLVAAGAAHPDPAPVSLDDVTIVVPVRDRPAELARLLTALHGLDVLVVDDGSTVPVQAPRLLRRDNGGPAAARNSALPLLDREFVAFVDSDVVVTPAQLECLRGHLEDPAVVAAAPRVLGDRTSPLDLGPHPAAVAPGTAVSYVPTACLLVRRSALLDLANGTVAGASRPESASVGSVGAFDEGLRYGEDVDLVWRLVDAGGTVRYDPSVVVHHTEPPTRSARLTRRYRYGTSAAPLALRHPDRLTHLVLPPLPTAVVALALASHPAAALAAGAVLTTRIDRQVHDPVLSTRLAARGVRSTALGLGRFAALLGPLAWLVALKDRRVAALLLVPYVLDPSRGSLLDQAAYGAGVVAGCVQHRTTAPLRPRAGSSRRTAN